MERLDLKKIKLTWNLEATDVDGLTSSLTSLSVLQLLFQALQLEHQRALFCAQSLQHGLFLDQCLSQLVETVLQLSLAVADCLVCQLKGGETKLRKVSTSNKLFISKTVYLARYLGRNINQDAHLVPELLDFIFSILDSAL